jgi:molecular chaperone DnaJ
MTVAPCAACGGKGRIVEHPCHECGGAARIDTERSLSVEIPEGVDDGTRLRLTGRGGAGEPGAPPGDLFVEVRVSRDSRFERAGDDLRHVLHLGVAEAALGATLTVPLIDGGEETLRIEPGTQPGTVIRMSRQGMPRLRRRGRGDLYVVVDVEVPSDLSDEEVELLREFARLRGERADEPKRRRKRRSR